MESPGDFGDFEEMEHAIDISLKARCKCVTKLIDVRPYGSYDRRMRSIQSDQRKRILWSSELIQLLWLATDHLAQMRNCTMADRRTNRLTNRQTALSTACQIDRETDIQTDRLTD